MSETKAIIADDEAPLRTYLRSQLKEIWPELYVCGEAKNGREALDLVKNNRPDIAFLDIRMPGISGMEVAKEIAGSCWIVFVTAYDEYAVDAFEKEALDYLLKPVSRERLEMTVKRLKERMASAGKPDADLAAVAEKVIAGLRDTMPSGYLEWIRVTSGDGTQLISVDEVCYFKASDKYTIVMTKEGESLIRKPVKELVRELDPTKFWRIHRGVIVNANSISDVSRSLTGRGVLRLKERPENLTVSRQYLHLFKQM
jgi:DNA-binding LytR/AlgR family response regulator